ncbi:MAG: heme exporter protein CcmD [Burkholderiaceae bacterium]
MEFDRHTFYIAASYGMVIVAIIIEMLAVRRRRASALQQAEMMTAIQAPPTGGKSATRANGQVASEAS